MIRNLQPNKTNTFTLPEVPSERCFVRTGVYADGNCFIHCVLRAVNSSYRKYKTYTEHIKLVEQFRKTLTDWLTTEQYYNIGNGELFKFRFTEELRRTITKIPTDPTIEHSYMDIIHKLFTPEVLEKDIVDKIQISEIGKDYYFSFCKLSEQYVEKKLRVYFDKHPEKLHTLQKYIWRYFINLFQNIHNISLEKFRNELGSIGVFTESSHIECISRFTGYNFIFLTFDGEGRIIPYEGNRHLNDYLVSQKTLVFLWIGQNHFEIIGELDKNQYINRIFEGNDEFLQKFTNYLNSTRS